MACQYYVNEGWVSEEEFKKLLNEGLLDQLIATQSDFLLPGFKIKESTLKEVIVDNSKPIESTIVRKISRMVNVLKNTDENGEVTEQWVRNNPGEVIQDAERQIKELNEGKKASEKRKEKVPYLLVVKLGKGADAKLVTGKGNHNLLKKIPLNLAESMKEGYVYMLVPSAYNKGVSYPIRLRSSKLGEVAEIKKKATQALKDLLEGKDTKKNKTYLESLLYRTQFKLNEAENTIDIIKNSRNEETLLDESNTLATIDLSLEGQEAKEQFDEIMSMLEERVLQVDHSKMNNPQYDSYIFNNGIVTTDLYAEDGNFFNSAGFILEPFGADSKTKSIVRKAMENFEFLEKADEETQESGVDTSDSKNKNRSNENSINTATKEELESIKNLLLYPGGFSGGVIVKVIKRANGNIEIIEIVGEWRGGKGKPAQIIQRSYSNIEKQEIRKEAGEKYETAPYKYTEEQLKNIPRVAPEVLGQNEIAFRNNTYIVFLPTDGKWVVQNKKTTKILKESSTKNKIIALFKNKKKQKAEDEQFNKGSLIVNTVEEEKGDDLQVLLNSEAFKEVELEEPSFIISDKDLSAQAPEEAPSKNLASNIDFGNVDESQGEDLDPGDSPHVVLKSTKENDRIWDKAKELKWLMDKISNFLIPTKVDKKGKGRPRTKNKKKIATRLGTFESIEELRDYLPNETYEMLLEARKQGKYIHGIFTKAAVYLNENAFEGTAYHEAFHIVFNLALTLPQRIELLTDALETYPEEIKKYAKKEFNHTGDVEFWMIEEYLADMFMEYVQTNEEVEKNTPEKIKTFFKSLYRGTKLFLGPDRILDIDELFADINLGIYKQKFTFADTDLSTVSPSDVKLRSTKIRSSEFFINPVDEITAFDYMTHKFFNILDALLKEDEYAGMTYTELINEVGSINVMNLVLKQIMADWKLAIKNDKKSLNEKMSALMDAIANKSIVQNKDTGNSVWNEEYVKGLQKGMPKLVKASDFTVKFMRRLRKYGIRMDSSFLGAREITENEVNELEEELEMLNVSTEEGDILENWMSSYIHMDPVKSLSQRLRIKLGRIAKKSPVDNRVITNIFGSPVYLNGAKIYNELGQYITDSHSVDHMIDKLKDISNPKPFIRDVIDMVESDPVLAEELFLGLGTLTNQNFLVVYDKNGEISSFFSNRASLDILIRERIIGEVLYEGNPLFNKYTNDVNDEDNYTDLDNLVGQSNFESVNKNTLKAHKNELQEIIDTMFYRDANNINRLRNLNDEESLEMLEDISKFMYKNLNINITPEQLAVAWKPNRKDVKASWENIGKIVTSLNEIYTELSKDKNPFLVIAPEESVQDLTKRSGGNKIANLVSYLKPGLEDEVITAFRNAENKTVYSIQLANHLSRIVSQFKNKEDLKAFIENVSGDPVLSELPILKDLYDSETEEMTALGQEFNIAVFDALSKKGKTAAVPYTKLNAEEMVKVDLGLFYNNGDHAYSYFKLPIPADAQNIPYIKMNKFTKEEIVSRLLQVVKGEIKRINYVKNLPEDHPMRLVPNYTTRGRMFLQLPFLNEKLDLNNLNTSEKSMANIKALIEDYLENEYLREELIKLKKLGVVKDFNLQKNEIVVGYGIVTRGLSDEKGSRFMQKLGFEPNKNKNISNYLKSYLWNSLYANTQFTTLFSGDPAFYSGPTNYSKRNKQIVSPKLYNSQKNQPVNMLVFEDEYEATSTEINDFIQSLLKQELESGNINEDKYKELSQIWNLKTNSTREKDLNNTTDGSTFISVDRRLDQLDSLNRLTQKHIDAAQRIKEGTETVEDIAMFPPMKPHVFTHHFIDGVRVPVQIKNSEVVLTKTMALRKNKDGSFVNPKLAKVYDILENGMPSEDGDTVQIDAIPFISAVKVGAIGQSLNEDGSINYSTLELDPNATGQEEFGPYKLSTSNNILTITQDEWGLQQETPPHYIDEEALSNFGTQIRQLIIGDLDLKATYTLPTGEKISGQELVNEYTQLIIQNLKESYEKVQKKFLNDDNQIDYEKLSRVLKKEIEDRDFGDDFLEAVEIIDRTIFTKEGDEINVKKEVQAPTLPYWFPATSYKIFSVLNALFKNNITKQKIFGGQMINATSFGFSEKLKIEKNEETGSITFQALVPWNTKKYFPIDENGEVDLSVIPEELKTLIGYRIPTEDKYSMFNIKIVGFTDLTSGGQIILPAEATSIAGLDFDIDKLFMMLKSYYLVRDKETGKLIPKYIKPLKKGAKPEEIINHIFRSNSKFADFAEKYFKDGLTIGNKKYSLDELLELRTGLLEDIIEAKETKERLLAEPENKKLYDRIQQLKVESKVHKKASRDKDRNQKQREKALMDYEESQAIIYALYNKLEAEIPFRQDIAEANASLTEIKEAMAKEIPNLKVDIAELNDKKARDNRIIELMQGILLHKNSTLAILDVGSSEPYRETGNRLKLLKSSRTRKVLNNGRFDYTNDKLVNLRALAIQVIEEYKQDKDIIKYRERLIELAEALDESNMSISSPTTQLEFFIRNMTGRDLTGIFANHVVHHAKSQNVSVFELAEPIIINGVKYKNLRQSKDAVSNNRISKELASLVATILDNASDPIAADLMLTAFGSDTAALMLRLGMSRETVFNFLNQPILLELTNRYYRELGGKGGIKPIVDALEDLLIGYIKTGSAQASASKEEDKIAKAMQNRQKLLPDLDNIKVFINDDSVMNTMGLEDALGFDINDLSSYNLNSDEIGKFIASQIDVLNLFKNIKETADYLSQIVQISRVDTQGGAVGPSGGKNFVIINKQQRVLTVENPPILGASNFLYGKNNLNAAFQKYAIVLPISILNKIFPHVGEVTESEIASKTGGYTVKWSLLGEIKNYFSRYKQEGFGLTESEANTIDSHFMSFFASRLPLFNKKHAEKILSKTPQKLDKIKKKFRNTIYSDFLEQLHVKPPTTNSPIPRIAFYNTGKDSQYIQYLKNVFRAMLTSKNKEVKEFAFELVQYTFFSSGFAFSPFSFYHLVPTYFWTDEFALLPENAEMGITNKHGQTLIQMMERAMGSIREGNLSESYVKRFMDSFFRNTAEKSRIFRTVEISDEDSDTETITYEAAENYKLEELGKEDVAVYLTDQEGHHASGISSRVQKGGVNLNAEIKGKQGKRARAGITGKLVDGKDGKGFALRGKGNIITNEDGSLEFMAKNEKLENTTRLEIRRQFKEDFRAMVMSAINNPTRKFVVYLSKIDAEAGKALITSKGQIDAGFIKQIIKDIEGEIGIPKNVILPKRFNKARIKKIQIDAQGRMLVKALPNMHLTIYDPTVPGNRSFPAYLKIQTESGRKKVERLFIKIPQKNEVFMKEGDTRPFYKDVLYQEVMPLGLTNFVLEYDFNNDIPNTESLGKKLTKNFDEPGLSPEQEEAMKAIEGMNIDNLDSQLEAELAAFEAEAFEEKLAADEAVDFAIGKKETQNTPINLETVDLEKGIRTPSTEGTMKSYKEYEELYNNYLARQAEKNVTTGLQRKLTKEQFEKLVLNEEEANQMLKRILLNC
jgi:hypothetical protein